MNWLKFKKMVPSFFIDLGIWIQDKSIWNEKLIDVKWKKEGVNKTLKSYTLLLYLILPLLNPILYSILTIRHFLMSFLKWLDFSRLVLSFLYQRTLLISCIFFFSWHLMISFSDNQLLIPQQQGLKSWFLGLCAQCDTLAALH